MKKKDLIIMIHDQLGMTLKEAESALESALEIIKEEFCQRIRM